MPITYLAGTPTGGIYPGISVNNPIELLTELKNTLTAAGQTVTDEISASNRIIARGVDQGDFCDKIYTVEIVSGVEYNLILQGDNTVNGGIVNPKTIEIPFFANGNAKLYCASDEGAECITIINSALSKGFHAGWLDRRRGSDKGSWAIGYLDMWMTDAFFARDIHDLDWREIKTYYYSNLESFTSPKGPYQHLFDSGCSSIAGTPGTSSASTVTFNYKPWLGQTDSVSGEPTLLPYGYLQGADAYNNYSNIDPNQGQGLHNPGWVRFARTGMAFMEAGAQCREGTKTFVSAGGSGANAFTGFQIAD